MRKFFLGFGIVLFILVFSSILLIFIAAKPVPEGAEEIIDKVFSTDLPEQITGETGIVESAGLNIWYESIKPKSRSKGTILLIMGLGGNALEWPLYFTRPLVDSGYHVIRFDNRSTGLSTWTDNDFTLRDLTGDAIALMNALEIDKAHIIGMSMGGMIGQMMAIEHPERVHSLISFMSSGFIEDPELPSLSRSAFISLIATGIRNGIPRTERNIIKTTIGVRNVLTPELSVKRMQTLAEQSLYNQRFRKGFNPEAFVQQTIAVKNSGSRYEGLKNLMIPTIVIHGKEDPLIPVEHAIKTASIIPKSELLLLDGMGHDLSPEHAPLVHEAVMNLIRKIR
jgi:pimeloyl-ACP methyl ester carboxylesterase